MSEEEPKYDVAISFLYRDEALALKLHEELTPTFNVFVFSKQQESLAGESGIEEFRDVFRTNSRLVVVLFRDGWGETRWTRVEKIAIEERFLNDGPASLLFVMMEKGSTPPKWLPETRIRLSLADYGYEQLVGAIKHRATVLGSKPEPDDAVAQARKVARDIAARAERDRLFHLKEGVDAATAEAHKVFQRITESADQINQEMPALKIEKGVKADYYVITNRRVGLRLSWYREWGNVMGRARLTAWEMNGSVPLPTSSGSVWPEPREVGEHRFLPDYVSGMGWCWQNESGGHMTSDQVAKLCFVTFLTLIERKDRGELPDLLDQA